MSAGGNKDTVMATVYRATRSLNIDTGTGKLDKVIVGARSHASGG